MFSDLLRVALSALEVKFFDSSEALIKREQSPSRLQIARWRATGQPFEGALFSN